MVGQAGFEYQDGKLVVDSSRVEVVVETAIGAVIQIGGTEYIVSPILKDRYLVADECPDLRNQIFELAKLNFPKALPMEPKRPRIRDLAVGFASVFAVSFVSAFVTVGIIRFFQVGPDAQRTLCIVLGVLFGMGVLKRFLAK